MFKLIILIVLCGVFQQGYSLENGLARTPPMGWMSWQRYRCITDCDTYPDECINEKLFIRTADLLAENGYRDAGYEYVIIDDCWLEKNRDNDGNLVADRERFPNGIKKLSDYIHSKGLKFGMYQDYGTKTCAGYPGLIGHEEQDAEQFADWGVDYIKIDACFGTLDELNQGFPKFGEFLNATGRPIVYSCSWPGYMAQAGGKPDYSVIEKYCNLWRNAADIDDSWHSVKSVIEHFAKHQNEFQPHAGPGHWNDPDMLVLGGYGLSYDQSKAQMAIWSILAAPLLMSNDLRFIQKRIRDILLNSEILAVSQDRLGIQGKRTGIDSIKKISKWIRPIEPIVNGHYSYAVAFLSYRTDGAPHAITVPIKELGFETTANTYAVSNLYDKTKPALHYKFSGNFNTRINPSGVQFFKFTALD